MINKAEASYSDNTAAYVIHGLLRIDKVIKKRDYISNRNKLLTAQKVIQSDQNYHWA